MASYRERLLRRPTPIDLRPSMPAPVPISEGRFDPDAIKSTLVGTPQRSLWVVTLDAAATGETYDTWIMKVPQGFETRGEGDQRDFYRISDGRPLGEDALLYPSEHPVLKRINTQYTPSPVLAELDHDFAVALSVFALGNHYTGNVESEDSGEDGLIATLPLERRLALDQHAFPGEGVGMQYTVNSSGEFEDFVDTNSLTPEVLNLVGFSDPLAYAAMKAIELINDGADGRVFAASHYRTRDEIERWAGEQATEALITQGLLELHTKWRSGILNEGAKGLVSSSDPKDHLRHPQAPYRISPTTLHDIFYPENQ